MTEMTGELIQNQEQHPEVLPDLLAVYGQEVLTINGITDTAENLLKKCPFPHASMTLEAKNLYLAVKLNEAGAEISEEHFSYFQTVLEARNDEVKVTIRQEPAIMPDQESARKPTLDEVAPKSRETTMDDAITVALIQDRASYQAALASDESLRQMDAWLNHERRQAERPPSDVDLARPAPIAVESEPVVKESSEPRPAARTVKPGLLMTAEVMPPEVKVEAPQTSAEAAETIEAPEPSYVTQALAVQAAMKEIWGDFGAATAPIEAETGWTPEAAQLDLPAVGAELMPAPLPALAAVEATKTPAPLTMNELVADYQPESEADQNEPQPLLEQLRLYITEADTEFNPEVPELLATVEGLADDIAQLIIETDSADPEAYLQLMVELEATCQELFEAMGIKVDQATLQRFITTITQESLQLVLQAQAQAPEDEGTHEHKLFTAYNLLADAKATVHNFRLIGSFAVAGMKASRI